MQVIITYKYIIRIIMWYLKLSIYKTNWGFILHVTKSNSLIHSHSLFLQFLILNLNFNFSKIIHFIISYNSFSSSRWSENAEGKVHNGGKSHILQAFTAFFYAFFLHILTKVGKRLNVIKWHTVSSFQMVLYSRFAITNAMLFLASFVTKLGVFFTVLGLILKYPIILSGLISAQKTVGVLIFNVGLTIQRYENIAFAATLSFPCFSKYSANCGIKVC